MDLTLLILAAGMGSRYGGIKQLDPIGPSGETIMDYSIYDAKRAGFNKIIFVIRKSLEKDFKEQIFSKYKGFIVMDYVFQELEDLPIGFSLPKDRTKPWGTAHAVLSAHTKIKENFAVINADDFYGASAYLTMSNFFNTLKLNATKHCLLTYSLIKTTSKNGSVSRGICQIDKNNNLIKVVEHTNIVEKENKLFSIISQNQLIKLEKDSPTSMNFMGFSPDIFVFIKSQFIDFLFQNLHNLKSEFFLPDILSKLIEKENAQIPCIPTTEQWFGVTYQEDKGLVIREINRKVIKGDYPKNLFN
jgi:NDP-sugar pyrophosphorylase family protein